MQLKPLALILAYYEHELSPAQQAKARELLRNRMDQVERMHDRMASLAEGVADQPQAPRIESSAHWWNPLAS